MTSRTDALPGRDRPYRAAVAGLGSAGWKFDVPARGRGPGPLTHAGAYDACGETELVAGCSPDEEDRRGFEARFGVPTFADYGEMLAATRPEIVSICSPTSLHFDQTAAAVRAGVPMIWLEKPPAGSADEVRKLDDLIETSPGTTLLVNYQRRYSEPYKALKRAIEEGKLGEIAALHASYSRGLELNGSHMVDTLFFLTADKERTGPPTLSTPGEREAPSFSLPLAGGAWAHVTGYRVPYHCIEISVVGTRGRATIGGGGMEPRWERVAEHELFPGYHRLRNAEASTLGEPDLDRCAAAALEDLIESHRRGRSPASSLATALQTQHILEKVRGDVGD